MRWFKRHLNWTLLLVVCVLQIIFYPLLMVLAHTWVFWVMLAIGILVYYGIFDWVLTEKGGDGNESNWLY